MIRRIFFSEESPETGELGWKDSRIKNKRVYTPNPDKLGVAHDAMEHFDFRDIGDEIEAHAAMYYIRYLGGYCSENGSNLDLKTFGYEFPNLAYGSQSNQSPYFLDINQKVSRKLDSEVEDDLEEIIQHGTKIFREEGFAYTTDKEILKYYAEYFRRGFRKTLKLYNKASSCRLAYMFQKLEYEMKTIGRIEEYQILTIKLNPKTEEVKVYVDYAETDE